MNGTESFFSEKDQEFLITLIDKKKSRGHCTRVKTKLYVSPRYLIIIPKKIKILWLHFRGRRQKVFLSLKKCSTITIVAFELENY